MIPPGYDPLILTEIRISDGQVHIYRCFDSTSNDKSVMDVGIRDGSSLLAWNGNDINGVLWKGESELINIKVNFPPHPPSYFLPH